MAHPPRRDYDTMYRSRQWAYSDKPDEHLIRALTGLPRGKALDLGGGQGRHALALAALGFDVLLVDNSAEGLHQAVAAASERGVGIDVLQSDINGFHPEGPLQAAVASLFFHLPPRRRRVELARDIGQALAPGGLFYVSLTGYNRENEQIVEEVFQASGCRPLWVLKHLVTKKERPGLSVPRRNETRALARAPRRAGV